MALSAGKRKLALPLPALLSQVLVAFTIEFDNEFERRSPHRTTVAGKKSSAQSSPWLTSMVMWANLIRLVPEDGITVGELRKHSRAVKLSLAGMERWGYIRVGIDPKDARSKPREKDWMIWLTVKGRMAQEVWRPLAGIIEGRWEGRFGKDAVGRLKQSLSELLEQIEGGLPEYLPVVGYGLFAQTLSDSDRASIGRVEDPIRELNLSALLAKVLLEFTIEFEREAVVSLPVCANLLRIMGDEGMRIRDLARSSGVSREGISMAVSFLKARGFAVLVPDPKGGRGQVVLLTSKGVLAKETHGRLLRTIEERWNTRFGGIVSELRAVLEQLVGDAASRSPLFAGLTPYPEGWRAAIPAPETLPHYPMVLHRGGYPDGS
jgi:DNA-binding MarR family transcriptional regulator